MPYDAAPLDDERLAQVETRRGAPPGKLVILAGSAPSLLNFRGRLIAALVERGWDVVASAPDLDANVDARLRRMGVRYRPNRLARTGLNPLQDTRALLDLARWFRQERPEAVLSYTIKPVIYGTLAARLAGVQRVYCLITGRGHALASGRAASTMLRMIASRLYRASLKRSSLVMFQNPDDRAFFRRQRLLTKKTRTLVVNGSGVDLEHFAPAPPRVEPVTFLLIARLIWDKGIGEYVRAARALAARYPDARFHLLGPADSNPRAIPEPELAAWQRSGVITYLGATTDVRPFLAEASVFVLPSYYPEGVPRSILEALAMGRPIVTTNTPGCKETVDDGWNGFLVPARDAEALAQAMERFLADPALIAPMGACSRALAEQKYDVHKVNAHMLRAMGMA